MPTSSALSAACCATPQVRINPASVAARRGATGGALRHQQPQYVLCNPSNQAAARLLPPAALVGETQQIDESFASVPHAAARRVAASAAGAGSQVHLQRRALRACAARNARRAPCTHVAARWRCGRHVARRAAACARLQSRVLHRAEAVRAPQTAADGGLEHHACFMCDEQQLRDDAAASGCFLMQSGSSVRAESATAAPRAADASAARRYRPECGATRAPCSTPVRQQC